MNIKYGRLNKKLMENIVISKHENKESIVQSSEVMMNNGDLDENFH